MEPIIQIKNIGKRYNISAKRESYIALRDVLTNILKKPLAFLKAKTRSIINHGATEEFWALRGVNLEIKKGEVVGIIGANGAGKSTLLKILTGITPPTEGEIVMHGRVASLLEVGTGFHPELTGRENIFLNGAILGMTRKEMHAKIQSIIEFSGIEKFIDTPVKRYSSGMYVRLAFSVAAHLEPDILLVDEVLAVGDAEFQKKCLGKMEEVTQKQGRTILFVSHNLGAIEQLCHRTILIEKGKVRMIGKTKDVILEYLATKELLLKTPVAERKDRKGSGRVTFTQCETRYDTEKRTLKFNIYYKNNAGESFKDVKISLNIRDQYGTHISNVTNDVLGQQIDIGPKEGGILLDIEKINLSTGTYFADLFLATDTHNSEILDWLGNACSFEINNNEFYTSGRLQPVPCKILFDFKFENRDSV
ncbi:MAG: ABC transporter ATP-binding protein [bacterium]|nr:ABC transporter ATP-binding protein [bacterium]